jgi:hypothetical protein
VSAEAATFVEYLDVHGQQFCQSLQRCRRKRRVDLQTCYAALVQAFREVTHATRLVLDPFTPDVQGLG